MGTCHKRKKDSQFGFYNSYTTFQKQQHQSLDEQNQLSVYYNSLVYGFEFIYSIFKEIVLPVVYTHSDGKCEIGTAFKINGGIATAKHCLEGAESIAIQGFTGEALNQSTIYISDNPNLDIAFIETPTSAFPYAVLDNPKVTEEILVMGFPRVAGFIDFLTAEPAMISSIGQRLTPTKGTVAAFGMSIFEKCELLLITAKIKGGNSGGPIINKAGRVVGITCHLPAYEGEYDDVGYGIAVPATALIDVIERKPSKLCVAPDYFIDFVDG